MFLDKKSSLQLSTGQLVPAFAIVDDSGNQVTSFSGGTSGGSSGIVTIANTSENPVPVISGLEIPKHNQVSLVYSGANLVGVAYSFNNVGVATLTLSYDGNNNLIFVSRS